MTRSDDEFDLVDAEALLAAVEPVAPRASTRDALLAAIAGPWYAPFMRRVAELCDLTAEGARELLVSIDDAARWMAGMAPGCDAFHIEAGPSLEGAVVGFIRLAPGAVFPEHTHVGDEDVLCLQGSFVIDGRVVHAGEEAPMAAGTTHEAKATDEGCLYLGVVRGGLAFKDGGVLDPSDPRV